MNRSFSDTSPANEQTSDALASPESETIPPPQAQQLDLPTELTSPDNDPPIQQENPLDIDLDYDKLVLTRGQDFDLDYTLLGSSSFFKL